MIKNFFVVIIILLLSACDAYDDMSSMFEKQKLVQDHIKSTKGYNTQVGFNINNGVLVQVTVYFQSVEVKQVSVEELEQIALTSVAQFFKLMPKKLNVAIQSVPDEKKYKELQNATSKISPQSNPKAGREQSN